MKLNVEGLTAVVFGGSRGIGAQIVKQLSAEGAKVHFCGRNIESVEFLLSKLKDEDLAGNITGAVVDINDGDNINSWLASIGNINIAISCVSALSPDWATSLKTDIRGTINVTEAVMPYLLKAENASFTWIGSKASSFVTPGFESYGASKAAMVHYIKTTAAKYTSEGVRVNIVSPGDTFVEEGFWDQIKKEAPEVYESTVSSNPLKRLATPEEIASVAVFIASPKASFVSGANWHVDGGATAHITL